MQSSSSQRRRMSIPSEMLQRNQEHNTLLQLKLLVLLIILQLQTLHIAWALPTGAPVCTVGEAAPQVLHLDPQRNPQLGSIQDGGYYIQIGNTRLIDTERTYNFFAHRDYPVIVSSDSEIFYKGVLLVLSKVGFDLTSEFFLNSTQSGILQQPPCDSGRAAVTHTSPEFKRTTSATMNFQNNYENLKFDVNIVLVNDDDASIFYWNQFTLRVSGATEAPTPVPRPTCGLFGMSILCLPKITFCGFFGRLLGQDQRHCIKKGQLFAFEE